MPLNAIEGTGTSPGVPVDVPEPQAVLGTLTTSAAFLVVSVRDAAGADARVLDVAADIGSLVRAVGFRQSEAGLTCVVGFGSRYWDRVRPDGPRPAHLHPFRAIQGARHDAVATPGDVFFHVRANRQDLVFELTRLLMDALGDDVQVEDHTVGFRYFDSRDLLGFVDGTENPTGRDAAAASIVGLDAEPDFAGGSYVVVQKYVHDLAAWHALPVEEQERVIGRTKLDDVELDDAVQPSNSHVSLNTIVDEDGEEHDILRDNMAFGDPSTGEYGTFFIAYADDPSITELMLERMFVGAPAGNYDRILDVSTAITGSLFFVPSLPLLESLTEGDDPTVTSGDLARIATEGPTHAGTDVTRASREPKRTPSQGADADPLTTGDGTRKREGAGGAEDAKAVAGLAGGARGTRAPDGRPSSSAPSAPGSSPAQSGHHDDDLRIGSLREEPQ